MSPDALRAALERAILTLCDCRQALGISDLGTRCDLAAAGLRDVRDAAPPAPTPGAGQAEAMRARCAQIARHLAVAHNVRHEWDEHADRVQQAIADAISALPLPPPAAQEPQGTYVLAVSPDRNFSAGGYVGGPPLNEPAAAEDWQAKYMRPIGEPALLSRVRAWMEEEYPGIERGYGAAYHLALYRDVCAALGREQGGM